MSILAKITLGAIPVAKSAAIRYGPDMAGRRGWGEDSIYFDHSGECRAVAVLASTATTWMIGRIRPAEALRSE